MGKNDLDKAILVPCMESVRGLYPYFFNGTVVHGFGRGSRQLGCPTANLDEVSVSKLPNNFPCGVFYGLAQVDNGEIYGMVMSIGWNPQFKNEKKTIEVHILHEFEKDFYGSHLNGVTLGYLRAMETYKSLDELIEAINNDISLAKKKLSCVDAKSFETSNHFSHL